MKIPVRIVKPFLKSTEVETGDTLIVITAPAIQPADQNPFNREQTIVEVKLERTGEERKWGLNEISNARIIAEFGSEGESWVGRKIRIQKSTIKIQGEEKPVLYAVPELLKQNKSKETKKRVR